MIKLTVPYRSGVFRKPVHLARCGEQSVHYRNDRYRVGPAPSPKGFNSLKTLRKITAFGK